MYLLNALNIVRMEERALTSYMKGCAAFSDWIKIIRSGIPAMGAACTDNLILSTSVCYKLLKVNTAKGIKTSSQVITVQIQIICNAYDAHT
jgi:hypothetical protein